MVWRVTTRMIGNLFHTILIQPLFNALIFLYHYASFRDMGVAVILLTALVRIVLWPIFHRSARSQAVMQKIQPEVKKIQNDHKEDRAKQAEALLALYRKHNISPFGGIVLLLVQLPVIFALYRVFLTGFGNADALLYGFSPRIETIEYTFLGVMPLDVRSIPLAFLTAMVQFIYGKYTLAAARKKESAPSDQQNPMERMSKNMMYMLPGITLWILWSLPSVVGLYWITTTVFSAVQQVIVNKKIARDHAEKK